MAEAYIVDAVRTPIGRKGGALAGLHPVDLAAAALTGLMGRTQIPPEAIDDVIMGCTDQVGPHAANIARYATLAAGLPELVPAVTVDRQCGASQQALHFAAQAVASGWQDVVIAGGVQSMSVVPPGTASSVDLGPASRPAQARSWLARYGTQPITQFRGAELMAERWGITRESMEQFALESHQRAVAASHAGAFRDEMVALEELSGDEGPRENTSLAAMARLPALSPGGRLTAAVSSQISDGAAACVVASERALRRYSLTPRARVVAMDVIGDDPVTMLAAPIPVTERILSRSGIDLAQVDAFEVNEAFAPVVIAWLAETGADPDRVNVHGGAIALGHPIGASGSRLLATLLGVLAKTGGRLGLQVMCEGGGMANATLIERL
jgi:acetyl-CoA C-acetyltransferase